MITAPMTAYTPVTYSPMMPAMNPQQGAIPQQQPQAQMQGAIYNYPTASYYQQPQTAKSQFNGVNIEIINPTGNTAPMPATAPAYLSQPIYPAAVPVMTGMPTYPMSGPTSQAVVQAPQGATLVESPAAAPVATPVMPQPAAPVVMPQAQTVAPVATPVVTPQAQPQAATPVVPAPQIETPAAAPVTSVPAIDPATFAGKLQTSDLAAQKAAIEEVAELVKNDKTAGPILLDTQIFDALVGIINADTSALQGPTPEQIADKNRQVATPLEIAEQNKQYALYTIAFMQDRLNTELEQRNGQTLELKDLPCIETVINAAKSNPNPNIRSGAIAALSHIARPQYNADLKQIFDLAKSDEDAGVQETASKAAQALA